MTGSHCAPSQSRTQDAVNINQKQRPVEIVKDCGGLVGEKSKKPWPGGADSPVCCPVYFLRSPAAGSIWAGSGRGWGKHHNGTNLTQPQFPFRSFLPLPPTHCSLCCGSGVLGIYQSGTWVSSHFPQSLVITLHSHIIRRSFTLRGS